MAWTRIITTWHLRNIPRERLTCLAPGFLVKANKRLELDKTIAKVSQPASGSQAANRAKFSRDSSDLRDFLANGTPTWYSIGKSRRQQPYQVPKRFQSNFTKPGQACLRTNRSQPDQVRINSATTHSSAPTPARYFPLEYGALVFSPCFRTAPPCETELDPYAWVLELLGSRLELESKPTQRKAPRVAPLL